MTYTPDRPEGARQAAEPTKAAAINPDKLAEILEMPTGKTNMQAASTMQLAQSGDFRDRLMPRDQFEYDHMDRNQKWDYEHMDHQERWQYNQLDDRQRDNLDRMNRNDRWDCLNQGKCGR